MSLPYLPLLTGDDHQDLQTLFQWVYSLIRYFPNAVAAAVAQEVMTSTGLLGKLNSESATIEQIRLAPGLAFIEGNLSFAADTGWSTSGTASDKALTSGDSLVSTQDVLGTLITTLITKGILSP